MNFEPEAGTNSGLNAIFGGLKRVNATHVRRGAIFFVNIGVPLLVGAATGQSQAALAAVVVGMLFGFADNDGPLRGRLRLLLLDAGCIAGGALIGYLLRDNAAALWPAFITITFAVGLAARTGRNGCWPDGIPPWRSSSPSLFPRSLCWKFIISSASCCWRR